MEKPTMNSQSEVTLEMIREQSKKIAATLVIWTEGMTDLERVFRAYNEAINDAVAFVDVMAEKNPEHRMIFNILAAKMRKELPLQKEGE